jgi:putative component of toxin-antitoxin plasmid stabilization module
MQSFYFNECFPPDEGYHKVTKQLMATLKEFNVLLQKEIGIYPAIVTEKLPSDIKLGSEGNLQKVLERIPNLELRNLAFSLFIKYPIHSHFELGDDIVEDLLKNSYSLTVGEMLYDALNLLITYHNDGFLFTTATHKDLSKNQLTCKSSTGGKDINVDSLFGEENNTKYIEEQIKLRETASKSLWDQLIATLDDCRFNNSFKRAFEGLRDIEKISIITAFREAINRNLSSRFYPDTKHIADVTPQSPKQVVYELRIYTPTAIRVYFMEQGNTVFVGKIGLKSSPNQSLDIKQADLIINKLVLTGS